MSKNISTACQYMMFLNVSSPMRSLMLFFLSMTAVWVIQAQPYNELTPEVNRKFAMELFESGDYYNASEKLEKAYEDFKTNDIAWRMAISQFHLRNYKSAERWFTRIGRRDKTGEYPEAQLWKARMMKMSGMYDEAIGELNDILKSDADPDVKRAAQTELSGAILATESKESKRLAFNNAGKELNGPGSEWSAYIHPEGNQLFYSSMTNTEIIQVGEKTVIDYGRGKVASWQKDKWVVSGELPTDINREDFHTGSISISPDGQRMYFTRVLFNATIPTKIDESKIYFSANQGGTWGPAYEVKGVNGEWLSRSPCIGELFGNEVMYFSSDKPGGHGGFDLYYATKIDDQTFSDPINLGTVINGSGDEITPFYRDGRLYFSSDSQIGFGGLDIFRTDWDGSKWSKVENMGAGFNTSTDDFNFTLDASGHKGALLSNRPGGKSLLHRTCCDDIYTFTIAPIEVELLVTVMDGERKKEFRGVAVQAIDMEGDKMGITETQTSGPKGIATFVLGAMKSYRIIANTPGFYPDTLDFNTFDVKDNVTIKKTLTLMPMPRDPEFEVYTIEEPIRLNNIYYDYDDDKILPDAEPDLQLLVDLLNQYPDMVIELSSHTDARGNDDYNQKLSQRRAQSAKNWMVAKGVVESRIQPVGYGETVILNKCVNGVECTDEEHRFNRRTEFKIISGPTTIQISKKRLKGESGDQAPSKKK